MDFDIQTIIDSLPIKPHRSPLGRRGASHSNARSGLELPSNREPFVRRLRTARYPEQYSFVKTQSRKEEKDGHMGNQQRSYEQTQTIHVDDKGGGVTKARCTNDLQLLKNGRHNQTRQKENLNLIQRNLFA